MNEQVKFIVDRLNREPFKKSLTFLNFDGLHGNNLLQLLNDIFTEIEPKVGTSITNFNVILKLISNFSKKQTSVMKNQTQQQFEYLIF